MEEKIKLARKYSFSLLIYTNKVTKELFIINYFYLLAGYQAHLPDFCCRNSRYCRCC